MPGWALTLGRAVGELCVPRRRAGCRAGTGQPAVPRAEAEPHENRSEQAAPCTLERAQRAVLLQRQPDLLRLLPAGGCPSHAAARLVLEDRAAAFLPLPSRSA